jgi:potassium-transporting ATPase ATP-binding subunit
MRYSLKKIRSIMLDAFYRLSPYHMINNFILFIVWSLAVSATLILAHHIYFRIPNIKYFSLLTTWLWITLYFANIAEAIAHYKFNAETPINNEEEEILVVKKLRSVKNLDYYTEITDDKLRQGDLVIIEAGEIVPRDGVIVWGQSFVNESDLTGQAKPVLKSTKHSQNRIKGGSIVETDKLVIKIDDHNPHSIFANISKFMGYINREKSPLEIALQSLIIGLTILFIAISISLKFLASYIKIDIPILYLIALTVTLIPTTISGLLPVISAAGSSILKQKNIILKDNFTIDTALDINVIVFDKTGTITEGHRIAVDFIPLGKTPVKDLALAAYVASLHDKTIEGESIVTLAEQKFNFTDDDIDYNEYTHLDFSAATRISGCDYKSLEIRKGAYSGICEYLGVKESNLDDELLEIKKSIAAECGTPMIVTLNKQILGVVHVQDKVKRKFKKHIDIFKEHNMLTIMLTGDNEATTSFIAKKIGVHAYYSDTPPNKKLTFIKNLQNHGYTVAMVGDGANDAPAIARADLGVAFKNSNEYAMEAANVIIAEHDLSEILYIREVAKLMLVKRGALTIFSLTSDIAKYFTIIPALFSASFPDLAVFNFTHLHSLESVVLASLMFNSIILLILTPLALTNSKKVLTKRLFWRNLILYGCSGIIAPSVGIKLLDSLIVALRLV